MITYGRKSPLGRVEKDSSVERSTIDLFFGLSPFPPYDKDVPQGKDLATDRVL